MTAHTAHAAHAAHGDHAAQVGHAADRVERAVSRARFAGRQLWLAGLGAAAAAAGSVPLIAARGRRLIDRLAERGQPLAERQSARLDAGIARIESLSDRAGRTIQGARTLLRETAEYETRRLLERLDLATVADLRLLAVHLDTLDRKLDDYGRRLAETARPAD